MRKKDVGKKVEMKGGKVGEIRENKGGEDW